MTAQIGPNLNVPYGFFEYLYQYALNNRELTHNLKMYVWYFPKNKRENKSFRVLHVEEHSYQPRQPTRP